MGRLLRIEFPGAFYHVTSRGNEKKDVFWEIKDYKRFLNIITEAHEKYFFFIHCFVLMKNHYHLLIETPKGNLSKIMHYINSCYTINFNKIHNRVGHLFQGRYKSILIDKDRYLLELSRYIHLNPVRANLAKDPFEYKWNSFNLYLNDVNKYKWFKKDFILSMINTQNKEESIKHYKNFVLEGLSKQVEPLKNLHSKFILGDSEFIKESLDKIKKDLLDKNPNFSQHKLIDQKPSPAKIIKLVANYYSERENAIINRGTRNNKPRLLALYLIKKFSGLTNCQITKYFNNLEFSGVSKAVNRVKKALTTDENLSKEMIELEKEVMSSFGA